VPVGGNDEEGDSIMVSEANGATGSGDDLAIDLSAVRKTYRGRIRALRDVDLWVRRGEVFGLLGPNGAGKSTLVKVMMTVVRPSKARGSILGRPIGTKETLARCGYLPEHHRIPPYLTGWQAMMFYGGLAGVPRPERRRRSEELLELVGIAEAAKRKVGTYSKGMQQRLGIAQALVNDPELVLLDEPTDGVDPVGRREIRDILVRLRDEGRTVFLNSHLLSELEMVCGRVVILVSGEVRLEGAIEDLTSESVRYEIVIDGPAPPWIAEAADVRAESAAADRTMLLRKGAEPEPLQPLLDRLRADGRVIRSIRPVRESLEELFIRAVNEPEAAGAEVIGQPPSGFTADRPTADRPTAESTMGEERP